MERFFISYESRKMNSYEMVVDADNMRDAIIFITNAIWDDYLYEKDGVVVASADNDFIYLDEDGWARLHDLISFSIEEFNEENITHKLTLEAQGNETFVVPKGEHLKLTDLKFGEF